MTDLPRLGCDNVAFDWEGLRIVATVIEYDEDGHLVVANPHFDDIWHVPVDAVTITDERLNYPPADE